MQIITFLLIFIFLNGCTVSSTKNFSENISNGKAKVIISGESKSGITINN